MVKAPENFLDEFLSREKSESGKKNVVASKKTQKRKVSTDEIAQLKQNIEILWGIYSTPEVQEILARNYNIRFLNIESGNICLTLIYKENGILMEYELDMGSKKELAGAHLFKQMETNISKYFSSAKSTDELLKTSNEALQTLVDVLIERELSEEELWSTIARGEQINFTSVAV